mgnify:CR=1 FL=1
MKNNNLKSTIDGEKIIFEKVERQKCIGLKERLEAFYGKPIEKIQLESIQEIDIGSPVGEEFW